MKFVYKYIPQNPVDIYIHCRNKINTLHIHLGIVIYVPFDNVSYLQTQTE